MAAAFVNSQGVAPVTRSLCQWLTTGKVAMADFMEGVNRSMSFLGKDSKKPSPGEVDKVGEVDSTVLLSLHPKSRLALEVWADPRAGRGRVCADVIQNPTERWQAVAREEVSLHQCHPRPDGTLAGRGEASLHRCRSRPGGTLASRAEVSLHRCHPRRDGTLASRGEASLRRCRLRPGGTLANRAGASLRRCRPKPCGKLASRAGASLHQADRSTRLALCRRL
jgi:hypothetical protein